MPEQEVILKIAYFIVRKLHSTNPKLFISCTLAVASTWIHLLGTESVESEKGRKNVKENVNFSRQ